MDHEFVPFAKAPEVCDKCGELAEGHAKPVEWSQYREDLFGVLIEHGGVLSIYGGYDDLKTLELRAHLGYSVDIDFLNRYNANLSPRYRVELQDCSIDYKRSIDPHPDTFGEFAGTFTDSSNWVDVVEGTIFCKCGKLTWAKVGIRDKTLGQLIWLITHAGE